MILYRILIALAAVSLLVIIGIVVRKFPELTIVDAEAVPQVREAKKKKAIINDRVDRMTGEWGRRLRAFFGPLWRGFREAFRQIYRRAIAIEKRFQNFRPMHAEDARAKVLVVLGEAEALAAAGQAEAAEKKFIEAIALDGRSVRAYRGLADVYIASKQVDQAAETLEFLVRLALKKGEQMARDFANLGLARAAQENLEGTLQAFEHAVSLEPANPKYLDLLLDACILGGDKSRALEVFGRLQAVNPENKKLAVFAEAIEQMPAKEQFQHRNKTNA